MYDQTDIDAMKEEAKNFVKNIIEKFNLKEPVPYGQEGTRKGEITVQRDAAVALSNRIKDDFPNALDFPNRADYNIMMSLESQLSRFVDATDKKISEINSNSTMRRNY